MMAMGPKHGAVEPGTVAPTAPDRPVHPLYVRITHWINALAVLIMLGSGWQIYNASPLFAFTFPSAMTLGGWLAGGLLWHFAAM
jgi:thiosulfate reductase cytochrome b subunit